MKTLDDILFGFLIFFAIDRLIRICSSLLVGPWVEGKTKKENRIESAKLFSEFILIILSALIVWRYRKKLAKLTT
jgi:hypothetical protein